MSKSTQFRRHNHSHRRGATLILVLCAALIIAVIGATGLLATRTNARRATQGDDWAEAGVLALAGVEDALATIENSTWWRIIYGNNTEITPRSLGRGTLSWKLVDDSLGTSSGDGVLWDDYNDPVRVYGIGRVGATVRVYSVRIARSGPLSALANTIAVSEDLGITASVTASGGPFSSNDEFTASTQIVANVEADNIAGAGEIIGIQQSPISDKSMPSQNAYDSYFAAATAITLPGDGKLTASLLSADANPWGSTNADGIYRVLADRNVTIEISRIKGTLVVECQDGCTVTLTQSIFWEPHTTDYPILLIFHTTTNRARDLLQPAVGTVTEGGLTYPSQLNGLIHIIGQPGAASGKLRVSLGGAPVVGTVIVDQDALIDQAGTFVWDPNLYEKPPIGYGSGDSMRTISASCRWEAAP